MRNPSMGASPLPDDDGHDHVHAHKARGARGQRARRPMRDHSPRESAPREQRQEHVPREGAGSSEMDRDAAYEQASAEYFKPVRKEKKREGPAPVTHTHALSPRPQGHPRRSQG